MPHDPAYLEAEKKIQHARRLGITELDLNGMGLTELPPDLWSLRNLKVLKLGYEYKGGKNNLTYIPSEISNLARLQSLDVSKNQLIALPESLSQLEDLQSLNLSKNRLTELPEWIGKLTTLQTLNLSSNQITVLPESFSNLSQIQSLILFNNQLTDLPKLLSQFVYLEFLGLDGNPLNPQLSRAYKQGIKAIKDYLHAKSSPSKTDKARQVRKLKVFLCHATQDKPVIHELYDKLISEGWIELWLDIKKLLPGQDWQVEIKNAVESADIVIIFLSNTSINKDGFIQKELRLAKDIALEKTEGSIFLIPLRLDDCEVPRSLQLYQWANYFGDEKEQTYRNLLESLKLRLEDIKRKEVFTK
jgi:hypothetical protein